MPAQIESWQSRSLTLGLEPALGSLWRAWTASVCSFRCTAGRATTVTGPLSVESVAGESCSLVTESAELSPLRPHETGWRLSPLAIRVCLPLQSTWSSLS